MAAQDDLSNLIFGSLRELLPNADSYPDCFFRETTVESTHPNPVHRAWTEDEAGVKGN
jgi:hypothetical protein